jgi:hypothetical protein
MCNVIHLILLFLLEGITRMREGVTYEAFDEAYTELEAQGVKPTIMKIRELLGQGSYSTLGRYLKDRLNHHKEEAAVTTPAVVTAAVEEIWHRLIKETDDKVASIKAETDELLQSAEDRTRAAESREEEATAARQAMEVMYHAVVGERELFALDLKREKESHDTLQTSYVALKKEFKLLEEQSQAHLITLKTIQDRELKAYAERIADSEATHKNEISRLVERQESDRHSLIVELDQARVEMKNRDQALRAFEITFQNTFNDLKRLDDLHGQLLIERDQLKETLLKKEKHWHSTLAAADTSENNLMLIQEMVGGVGQSVLGIVKTLNDLMEKQKREHSVDLAGV